MRKIFLPSIFVALTGCLPSAEFDAASTDSVTESVEAIKKGLSDEDKEEFVKAILYFSVSGDAALTSLFDTALCDTEFQFDNRMSINLLALDGLTGQEIIERYHSHLAQDQIMVL